MPKSDSPSPVLLDSADRPLLDDPTIPIYVTQTRTKGLALRESLRARRERGVVVVAYPSLAPPNRAARRAAKRGRQ